MLENCDKIMHLRFNFDACPMHSPFGFVHLTHQDLSARALFCHNSLAKVNRQLLIYNYQGSKKGFWPPWNAIAAVSILTVTQVLCFWTVSAWTVLISIAVNMHHNNIKVTQNGNISRKKLLTEPRNKKKIGDTITPLHVWWQNDVEGSFAFLTS